MKPVCLFTFSRALKTFTQYEVHVVTQVML